MKWMAVLGFGSLCGFAPSAVLHYGGDFEPAALTYYGQFDGWPVLLYDDFVVGPGGWRVNAVTSAGFYELNAPPATQAVLEFRSDMSEGNGGSLLHQETLALNTSPTGRTYGDLPEIQFRVDGFNLEFTPGRYWLSLHIEGFIAVSGTNGLHGIGEAVNNHNAFRYWLPGYHEYASMPFMGNGPHDFSYGVEGQVLPEPSTLALLGFGVIGCWQRRRTPIKS